MNNCLFCKIAKKEIPANILAENEDVIAFHDIAPKAKIHILIVPKKHIESVNSLEVSDSKTLGIMFQTAKEIAKKLNVVDDGFRLTINSGKHAGLTVDHLHMHLLAGEKLSDLN